MLALENPHCGVSGVPFMNNTTGFEATAWSIAALVSVDRSRNCERVRRVRRGLERVAATDRDGSGAWRSPCTVQHIDHEAQDTIFTCESIVLDIMMKILRVEKKIECGNSWSESLPMTQFQD